MTKLTITTIQTLGFAWPKYPVIEQYCEPDEDQIDLDTLLERLHASRAYYQKQLDEAYAFKSKTGADYSDFTDRFDEYARKHQDFARAVRYLEEIIQAAAS
jgi:hypothetical protein